MIHEIIQTSLSKGMSYDSYASLMNELAAKAKTTGVEQTDQRINFTKLNASRMRRLDKTITIPDETYHVFNDVNDKLTWLVILESWCADGAQTIPILNKIVSKTPNIDLKIVLRDENPQLMNLFLTNGTQSIPKLIVLDEDHTIMDSWGPRSSAATNMVKAYKDQNGVVDNEFKKFLQLWYNKDKGTAIVSDLVSMVERSLIQGE